ncbi:MAG: LacI family DNA-binding transcriptional regulator [Pseudomonadota bacterium]
MTKPIKPKSIAKTTAARDPGAVTIEMVAQLAGVSPSTISRILNGTAVVSEVKQQAVKDAIAKLGYVPNPVARGLAGGRSYSIGVVTQTLDSPFYGASLRGIEEELNPMGYNPLFVSAHWDAAAEARCIDVLRSRRVDGIIVLTGALTDQALKAYAKKLPVVVTGRTLNGPGLFSLDFDNFAGGQLAISHLVELGHRRIALITGDPLHPDSNERLRGYRAGLEKAGIAYDPALVVVGDYTESSGLRAVEKLTAERQSFTAIFAANDQMASGAVLGLHRKGVRVPQDISIVGFDDLPTSPYAVPPLSSVHQSSYEQGRLSAHAMLQLLAGTRPTVTVPLPRLIARESSAPLSAKRNTNTPF